MATDLVDSTLCFAPAHQLARAVRARELSARELVDAYLARIERLNPALNAVVTVDADGARAAARAADDALARGEPAGPLHGVPITIKDLFDTAGLRTTYGYPPTSHHLPRTDATAVARLRAAGAIVLGKTNVPFIGFDWQCRSPIFGRTVNPWDRERTCGGSSGGSAASVAAGFAALELGSDIAGSIRVPAHFCGVFGLKTTEWRVSGSGHAELPGRPRSMRHLVCFGPMARSVRDLRLALDLVAGPDGRHTELPPVPLDTPADRPLRELRIAWIDELGGIPVSAEIRSTIERLAGELARAGCRVERCAPPGLDVAAALETWGEISGAELAATAPVPLRLLARIALGHFYGAGDWTRGLRHGVRASLRRHLAALARRDAMVSAMDRFLGDYDAWLLPVASVPAFRHCRTGAAIPVDGAPVPYAVAAGAYASLVTVTGSPALAMPAGHSREGLPIGVQLVGRRWHERSLLAVAERMEPLIEGFRPPPLPAAD